MTPQILFTPAASRVFARYAATLCFIVPPVRPSSFELPLRRLLSRTPVTYLCMLPGIHSVAAMIQLE
ncbi:hypothetical protein C5Y41_14275 [Rahnella variigena]|nr:hypothetical protein C5Y41_14275 [Rahnella variigena]